ncbi:MAG: hypothetical protein PWR10_1576 [Halanaerobiales bacterium]|nr:hypothetical protein [Halanaerobiales bacterium]
MNAINKTIANRIKLLRKTLGLTQKEFANKLQISRSTIGNIENGTNTISDQLIHNISREFGVREEWIRTGQGDMKKPPEEIIQEALSKLSPEEAREALEKIMSDYSKEKVLEFDKEKEKPTFYKVLDFLKKQYDEADRDMQGYLTVKIKKDFPEYEEHVKKNQPEQKNA